MDDWGDLKNISWGRITKSVSNDDEPKAKTKKQHGRVTACIELSEKFLYRRAYGEDQLFEQLGLSPLKDGHSYHCITGGNVDSLSYLKFILQHNKLDYCLFSTWCMSGEDILQFDKWIEEGKIKKLDAYVGEIFPTSYLVEWKMLNDLFARRQCGRLVCFRNHSKIFAGYGAGGGGFLLCCRNFGEHQHQSACGAGSDKYK